MQWSLVAGDGTALVSLAQAMDASYDDFFRDFERVRVGRNQFAEVCFTPGFENAISGCFVRIALGPHPETGIEQYRMASIKGRRETLVMTMRKYSNMTQASPLVVPTL